jgi:hypothetical protein
MDIYSFGLLMWEVFFEHVPFDNDVLECTKNVLNEQNRPKIVLDDLNDD